MSTVMMPIVHPIIPAELCLHVHNGNRACEFGKADVVKMLLSHNAEVNVFLKDSNATPLGAAAFLGYTDIVEAV